jgi:glycosyltransferase involved in cell wall biosynthesis
LYTNRDGHEMARRPGASDESVCAALDPTVALSPMASILFVSKPIAPPWNDSGKNLVRDVARGLTRHTATLMVRTGDEPDAGTARLRSVYAAHAGGFAPALADQARVFGHLAVARGHQLWHFFFAPNPKSCFAGRAATRLRNMRSVHTISSAPRDAQAIVRLLFADINVVLSDHTEQRLGNAGLAAERMVRIPPAIEPLTPVDDARRRALRSELALPLDAPIVLYPGDLEFGEGGPLMIEAQRQLKKRGVVLVMACRAKTARAREVETALRERATQYALNDSTFWLGETPRIHDLLACADVVALPSADLYAKMDYPLVLLEAMSLERPVLVASGGAAEELCDDDAAVAVTPHADAVAHEITRLLDDAHARALLGQRARAAVLERFTYHAMARAYEGVYDRLLG